MKYMLLIYNNPGAFEALSEEEREAEIVRRGRRIMDELTESGELVGGEALADPAHGQDRARCATACPR